MPFRRCKTTIVDQKSGTCSLSNLKILVKVHHSHFFSLSLANTQMKRNSCFPTSDGRNQADARKYRGKKQCQKGTNCLKSIFCPDSLKHCIFRPSHSQRHHVFEVPTITKFLSSVSFQCSKHI